MKLITSSQNPVIKHLRKLADSASYRQENKQTILDGVHLCTSYLQADFQPVMCVVGRESKHNDKIQQIISRQELYHTEFIEVPDSLFASFSVVDKSVGILFVVDTPELSIGTLDSNALLIDSVQDPGNLGTMLRTAAAAGVKQAFLSSQSANAWSPKSLRAGMGAQFVMDVYQEVDLFDLISSSKVPVFATSLEAKKTIYETDLNRDVAWLFGSEGSGVSSELIELCGKNTIIIPQSPGVESLNVASAAAVCLFEHVRQKNTSI